MPAVAQVVSEDVRKALYALFPEEARVGTAGEPNGAQMEADAFSPEGGIRKESRRKKADWRAKAKKARRRMRALEEMCRELAADKQFRDAVWRGRTRAVCGFVTGFAAFHGVVFRTRKEFWHAVRKATRLVAVGQ